jgi:hypothetical protein
MEPKEKDTPAGVGAGITGASGEMIEGTGHDQGVGGTGHDDDAGAAGMRPQDQYTARPDEQQSDTDAPAGTTSTRLSGSASGTVGGGGPNAVQARAGADPERPGGGGIGALGDVPGGIRNVSPANDNAGDPDHVHQGEGQNRSERTNYARAGNPGTDDEH